MRGIFSKNWFRLILAVLLFPAINLGLNELILKTSVPLFLDSIFTACAAVLGLPFGMLTAVLTNFYAEILHGFPGRHLPFALCGIATALIVWAMCRKKMLRTPLHFLLGTISVALANSVLGAIIATFVFGGGTGSNIDVVVAGFALAFENILSAAFIGRMIVNLIDKAPAILGAMLFFRLLFAPAEKPRTDSVGI